MVVTSPIRFLVLFLVLSLSGVALVGAVRMHNRPQAQAVQQIRSPALLDQSDLQKKVQELEQSLEAQERQTQELRQHKEQLTRSLDEANQEIVRLQRRISSHKRPQYAEAVKAAKGLRKKVSQMERSEVRLRQQIGDLEGKLKEAENLQAALRKTENLADRQQREHAQALDRLQKQLADSEESRQKLLNQIEQSRASEKENDRLRRELAKANDRIAELIVSLSVQEELSAQLQVSERNP